MKALVLIVFMALAFVITFIVNWVALIPWRRAKDLHWTERARISYPTRTAASANVWLLSCLLVLGAHLAWSGDSPHYLILIPATIFGGVLGTIPLNREIFPRIATKELFRFLTIAWLLRSILLFMFVGAFLLMPDQFGLEVWLVSGVAVLFLIFWQMAGWIGLCRITGLLAPAPQRIREIVEATATKMGIGYGRVFRARIPVAQAMAMPGNGSLIFTDRLLELMSDQELATVCAHELGHLSERRRDYLKRYCIWFAFLPWILVKPIIHAFDTPGLLLLIIPTALAPRIFRNVSKRLEVRADNLAKSSEADPGAYARALARLYEDNLIPAVHAKGSASHPNLYDRLIASGMKPDFPRPAPPRSITWQVVLFVLALGYVVVIVLT